MFCFQLTKLFAARFVLGSVFGYVYFLSHPDDDNIDGAGDGVMMMAMANIGSSGIRRTNESDGTRGKNAHGIAQRAVCVSLEDNSDVDVDDDDDVGDIVNIRLTTDDTTVEVSQHLMMMYSIHRYMYL